MAFYVEIIKTGKEEGNFIYYNYLFFLPIDKYKSASGKTRYKSKEVKGVLKIDRINGEIRLVELAEGDKGTYAQRATLALIKHWKKGEFPDKTFWAS